MRMFSMALCLTLAVFVGLELHGATKQEMGRVINLAGKQRMLTQKMSKEILLIALNIDREKNLKNLAQTAALFDKTLRGLMEGSEELGLVKTTNPAILAQLKKVQKMWQDFYSHCVKPALDGKITKELILKMAHTNLPLLKNMNKAVKMYEKEAQAMGGNSVAPAMARTINLAGKQRMLTQKMTKELLLIAYGVEVSQNRENLKKTVHLFHRTLRGLFDGDRELGLVGTKDPTIRKQLAIVEKLWLEYKPILEKAAEGQPISRQDLKRAAQINLPLLKNMNKAVKMYEKSLK